MDFWKYDPFQTIHKFITFFDLFCSSNFFHLWFFNNISYVKMHVCKGPNKKINSYILTSKTNYYIFGIYMVLLKKCVFLFKLKIQI